LTLVQCEGVIPASKQSLQDLIRWNGIKLLT